MKIDYILFSDGSVRKMKYGDLTGYGCVIVNMKTKQYTAFGGEMSSGSIAYAEGWAIYRGLQFINSFRKNKDKKQHILVVTDSKLTISILTDYIPNVWDVSDWNHWKKKNGTSVLNQDLYRNIVDLINRGNMKVRFVHMNSHLKDDEWKVLQKKMKEQNVDATDRSAKLFVQMNRLADEIATDITLRKKNQWGSDPGPKFYKLRSKIPWSSISLQEPIGPSRSNKLIEYRRFE